jgi:murein L,D-transpeptidase YcbB/YkuD
MLFVMPARAVPWEGLAVVLQRPGLVKEAYRRELARFYFAQQYRPLWFEAGALSRKAELLLAALGRSDREGLDPEDYVSTGLMQACAPSANQPLACELALSDALLRYASDVGYGVLQAAEADPFWHLPQQALPVEALLTAVADRIDVGGLLAELPPPHHPYARLRTALEQQRNRGPDQHWLQVPDGPTLRPGYRGERVLALRERLGSDQPELHLAADPALFDTELQDAIAAFQARHGLDEDGLVGPATLAALNVSREDRIAQIRLNMERWRWLPRDLEASHVQVNLAGFQLTLVQAGESSMQMRVINGRPDRASPAMQDRITGILLNPDWTVPRRLAVEDMLPQLQRDARVLQAKHIRVLRWRDGGLVEVDPATVDWGAVNEDNFPFLLRQSPGPHNSLGRLKFEMPNSRAIYLHDTPARGLFRKSMRAFSSGCIRVEKPLQLAARLLGDDAPAAVDSLLERIESGQTQLLPVTPPVPVYLVYLTAWVDETGNLQFRDDVYGRNVQLRDWFSFP